MPMFWIEKKSIRDSKGSLEDSSVNLPFSWIILFRYSIQSVFNALFFGGPILCGNNTEVSTTKLWINFNAFKSDSKLCPINIVFEWNIESMTAWISRRVLFSFFNMASVMPEYLQVEVRERKEDDTHLMAVSAGLRCVIVYYLIVRLN